jgi:hypothetical protein
MRGNPDNGSRSVTKKEEEEKRSFTIELLFNFFLAQWLKN